MKSVKNQSGTPKISEGSGGYADLPGRAELPFFVEIFKILQVFRLGDLAIAAGPAKYLLKSDWQSNQKALSRLRLLHLWLMGTMAIYLLRNTINLAAMKHGGHVPATWKLMLPTKLPLSCSGFCTNLRMKKYQNKHV